MKAFYGQEPMVVQNNKKALTTTADILKQMRPHPRGTLVLLTDMKASEAKQAAETLATTLASELQRVELSQIVSKHIGETEQNLRELFKNASTVGSILFFDEADALFGKRSEVKDAHDRYANVEIPLLLNLLESHQGIVMFTVKTSIPIVRARNRCRMIIIKGETR